LLRSWRSGIFSARLPAAELNRIYPSQIAQRAGGLLARARMSSDRAVDAFVVATALEFDV
jgi:hypothetical protein